MKTYKDWIIRYFSEHEDDEEDAVIVQELIRCKDCKFYGVCVLSNSEDGFCAWAKPKETE